MFYCVSVSYKNTGIELRQKLAFQQNVCDSFTAGLIQSGHISECVTLCTCNRTEVYFCGEKNAEKTVVSALSKHSDICETILLKHFMLYFDHNALVHLFKVASGIDSMVIGEDEILGQTRSAYLHAKENHTVSHELNMIFQAAFACAKKIKTKTALSKTSVSIATLAANEVSKFGNPVKVLVIGASGKIGSTVLKNLVSHKNVSVTATRRQHNSHLKLIADMGIETVDYEKRYDYVHGADCIISATSSPHYTITFYDLKHHITDGKKRLFIDLAVPPDMDPSIASLPGVYLRNIDYFKHLAKDNNALKLDSVDMAKDIIADEIDTLKKDLVYHAFLPSLDVVKQGLSGKPPEALIYKMKQSVSADAFSAFVDVLKTFENQV